MGGNTLCWLHVDLKVNPPPAPILIDHLRFAAAAGFDGVLIEWENMFPFRAVPEALSSNAYRRSEVERIVGECATLGLTAVPLVQTLGHLQWLLNVDRYRAQREFPERDALIRVCDPASWELLGAMVQELIDAHPQSPFVHVGADEAGGLERVDRPECSAARDGAGAVFARHLRPLIEMTIRSGRRPIVWSDMALRHSQALEELPRELVLMDWSYLVLNRFQPVVKLPSRTVVDETSLHELTGEDARLVPYLRAAPLAPPFPGIRRRPPSAYLDALATAPFLRDQGFDVIGAPSIQCGHDTMCVPDVRLHLGNCTAWAAAAREHGLLGLCCTCWSLRGQLLPVSRALGRAFVTACRRGEDASTGELHERIWRDLAGDGWRRAADLSRRIPGLPNWSNEARPVRYDAQQRRFRPTPALPQRLERARPSLQHLQDGHPVARQVGDRRAALDELTALIDGEGSASGLERRAWSGACGELALRDALWEAARSQAAGGVPDVAGLRRRLTEWSGPAEALISELCTGPDLGSFRTDRMAALYDCINAMGG